MSQFKDSQVERMDSFLLSSLFRLSTDQMRPTHSGEGNLLYSFLIQMQSHPETPSKTHPEMFNQMSGHPHGSVKLTHKINHHRSHFPYIPSVQQ